jgi:hypothetical protein
MNTHAPVAWKFQKDQLLLHWQDQVLSQQFRHNHAIVGLREH